LLQVGSRPTGQRRFDAAPHAAGDANRPLESGCRASARSPFGWRWQRARRRLHHRRHERRIGHRLCPQMLVGWAWATRRTTRTSADLARTESGRLPVAGYGGYVNGPWHLDGIFSYGFLQTDTRRFINVGPSIRKPMAIMMAACFIVCRGRLRLRVRLADG